MSEEVKKTTKKAESTKTETAEKKVAKKTTTKTATKTTTKTAASKAKTVAKTEKKFEEVKVAKAEKKEETLKKEELTAVASLNYARISCRKVAIVANLIRGKNVDEALAILKFTPKAGAEVLTKLLKSAIANAENNNKMTYSKLYIDTIYSNQGPTLKRIRPAAKGSAVRIRKRTSKTTIVLKERA